MKLEAGINGKRTDNVIRLKRRNGPWVKSYSGFLNDGNCETSDLVLIKLIVVSFQYFVLFHQRIAPYQVTQLEENVGILTG